MRGSLLVLAPLLSLFFAWVSTTSAQTPAVSSPDPCSSVLSYVESHPDCYVLCSKWFLCSWNNSYIEVYVDECKDPVTVLVDYAAWTAYDGDCIEDYSNSVDFRYVYNKSEIVDQGDTGRYSGILARNASHLGFELYVDRPGQGRQTLVDPVYFPLIPGECMCDSMQAVAEDMYWLNSSSCNKTNDECTSELLCTMEDSALQQVTMSISQCDNPPTLTLGMVANGQSYTTELTDNTTRALGDFGVTVIYTVWYYDYSMDIQIVAQNGDAYNEILSRHKIILDLTSCGPPRPLDLSTAPTPPTEFTAPTIPSTTDSSSSYDMCAALQSISFGGTVQCNTIQACTAVECDWYGRLEMQVDQCHYPPGIVIIVYDRQNQPVFNSTFNDGSTIVEDHLLPYDLKVTVQQMFPSFISVEVSELVRPPTPPPPYSCYIIIRKTLIPINKSSCFTLAPPTTAPTSTCSAMRYIQAALSLSTVDRCFFPVAKNCTTLTCLMGRGEDLTLRVVRCAHPPAVRITLRIAFTTIFDHTFNHSEVFSLQGVTDEGAALNVTLDQLCSSNSIGLQVDYKSSSRNAPVVPYTVIPINTNGCGPGLGVTCLQTSPPDSSDLCKAMNDISHQITTSDDETECSVSKDCKEVDCHAPIARVSFSMTLKCSPVGMTLTFINSSTSLPVTESGFFDKSGTFMDIYLVTVDGKTSKGFGFAVTIHFEAPGFTLDLPFVNRTYIPIISCSSGTPAALVIGLSVGVPFVVLLTSVIIIIVVVMVVYLVRRRRYSNYQLHQVAMSQVNEDELA